MGPFIKDVINLGGGGFAQSWSYLISLFSKNSRKVRFAHLPLDIQKSIVKNTSIEYRYHNCDCPSVFAKHILFCSTTVFGAHLYSNFICLSVLQSEWHTDIAGARRVINQFEFWPSHYFEIICNSSLVSQSQNGRLRLTYVVKTHFRALRARAKRGR